MQYVVLRWLPNDLYGKYGRHSGGAAKEQKSWALVTGASDGIGLAMCKELARGQGFNVLMVARNEAKLKGARDEVLKFCQNKVLVEYEIQDFSKITKMHEY